MEKTRIGLLDSGIGGVSVLRELVKVLPDADYYYFSDSKNNPYGDKSFDEIKQIIFNNVEDIINHGCKVIVIACNTATAVAIDDLREKYKDIVFIATEPAIKVVHDKRKYNGLTILLATKLTLQTERVQELLNTYNVKNLVAYPCSGLAELIENNEEEELDKYLKEHFTIFDKAKYVILGCTHYPLIKDKLKSFFKEAEIIDGSKGIAMQTKKMLEEHNYISSPFNIEFYDSSLNPKKEEVFRSYLD